MLLDPGSAGSSGASTVHATASAHAAEVERGERFEFGANWARFLRHLTPARVREAEASLQQLLEMKDLAGLRFLDIGSGSGLFSLAASNLGARVVSVDYDPQSVACTNDLKSRFAEADADWQVRQGSILDPEMVRELGQFDVVYSWGVLHHTGAMWQALEHATGLVAPGGRLAIAIYNHQVYWTRLALILKRGYVAMPHGFKWIVAGPYVAVQMLKGLIKDLVLLQNPLRRYLTPIGGRGMSLWYDWIDWVGGYPFEVARPEEIFDFGRARGFSLQRLKTCGGGHGCNEFMFLRS